jgi:hypothetical protein
MLDLANRNRIDSIIEKFDFERVRALMTLTDHNWGGEGIPSINKLKATAMQCLEVCIAEDKTNASPGGFYAFNLKYTDRTSELSLIFSLERKSNRLSKSVEK